MGIFDTFSAEDICTECEIATKQDVALENRIAQIDHAFNHWKGYVDQYPLSSPQMCLDAARYLLDKTTPSREIVNEYCARFYRHTGWRSFAFGGVFLSGLLQHAYDLGENDFVLDTSQLSNVVYLASGIHGTHTKKLKVTLTHDISYGCASRAKYLDVTLCGNTGHHLAHDLRHCDITLFGTVGIGSGMRSYKCNFYSPDLRTLLRIRQVSGGECTFHTISP